MLQRSNAINGHPLGRIAGAGGDRR
jgi:hypothetical protein